MMNRTADRTGAPPWRNALRVFVVFFVCAGLLVALVPPTTTEATWNQAEVAQAQFSAGSLPAPSSLSCQTVAGGLLGTDKARISWNTSAALPAGAQYEIVLQKSGGAAGTLPLQTEQQITIVPELLNSLPGLVLDLLSPPATYTVKVSIVYPGTAWRSVPTAAKSVRYTGGIARASRRIPMRGITP